MSESVSLPALGESVTEGTVTRWLKSVGDTVEVDEPLLEVSTDKVDTEIPSPVAGTIEKILVQEDETVEVGTALVTIGDGSGGGSDDSGDEAAASESSAEAGEEKAPEPEEAEEKAPEPEEAEEAPAADKEADQESDQKADEEQAEEETEEKTETEEPSSESSEEAPAADRDETAPEESQGEEAPAEEPSEEKEPEREPSGEKTEDKAEPAEEPEEKPEEKPEERPAEKESPAPSDEPAVQAGYVTPIVRKLANERGVDLASVTGTGVGGRIRKEDILAAQVGPSTAEVGPAPVVEVSELRGTTQPMSRLRKVVADRAVVSMQSSAQLTSVVEVDVTKIAALRERVKADFLAKTGNKLSFLPFFALAATEALKTYPVVNATVDGDSIVYPDRENLSIAVDTERGLLTPVIRDAGDLNLAELAAQVADLADRTRNNKLKPDELAGGTFTLTNTGSRGALFDTPIVFLPQVAILGTGIVRKVPVVVSIDGADAIAVRSTAFLALSYDHRIVDGADAARFLVQVKNRLEAGAFEGNLGI